MAKRIQMTEELARACAKDAAHARARAAGRTRLNADDYNEYVRTFNRLWPEGSE